MRLRIASVYIYNMFASLILPRICIHHCHEVKNVYDLGRNVTDAAYNTASPK